MIPDDSRSRDHRGVTWERRLARSTRSYIGTAVERAVEDNITCFNLISALKEFFQSAFECHQFLNSIEYIYWVKIE